MFLLLRVPVLVILFLYYSWSRRPDKKFSSYNRELVFLFSSESNKIR